MRYHGNPEAGFRHTKRGLYELGKTEELQKKMGVPVLKRTVEVSEYTSITVHIAQDQTFVHITSNPPFLPEPLVPPKEKEEKIPYRCPSIFIIRQMLTQGSAAQQHDGYLIGYDHDTDRWRVVKYSNPLLEGAAPQGGNLGWYHLPTDEAGTFNECDVLTWKKNILPNFRAFHPTYSFDSSDNSSLYFQGIKFAGPTGSVVGACILKAGPDAERPDNGAQSYYVYAHTVVFDWLEETGTYKIRDRISRKKLNDALNNVGSWYILWSSPFFYVSTDKQYQDINWAEPLSSYPDGHFLYGARSLDYIDPEGYAYYFREYIGGIAPGDDSYDFDGRGQQALIKQNMKTGSFTVECTPDFVPYVAGTASYTYEPTTIFSGYYQGDGDIVISNIGRSAPLYLFPGTQDLYLVEMEMFASHGCSYRFFDKSVPGTRSEHHAAAGSGISTFKITENRRRTIKTWDVTVDYSSSGVDANANYPEDLYNSYGEANMQLWTVFQYHPEMPAAEVSLRMRLAGDSYSVDIYLNQSFTNYCQITAPVNYHSYWSWAGTDFTTDHSSTSFMVSAPDMLYWLDKQWYTPAVTHYSSIEHACRFNTCGTAIGPGLGGFSLGWVNTDYHLNIVWDPNETGFRMKFGSFWYSTNNEERYIPSETPADMFLRKNPIDDSDDKFQVTSYAIHRPVHKGEPKPYIMVRKKIKITDNGYLQDPNVKGVATGYLEDFFDFQTPTGTVTVEAAGRPKTPALTTDLTGSLSNLTVDPDREETHWEDTFELVSNILTAKQLNQMTKESGSAFFEIGIL